MAIELDLTNDDPTRTGAFETVEPGNAHVVVVDFQEYGAKTGNHIVDLEILAHNDRGQVGKVHREFFSQNDAAVWRLRLLAVVCRLATVDELKAAKDAGKPISIEFGDCVGKQICVTLEEQTYDGKTSIQIGSGLFALDDDRCKTFPRNEAMLSRAAPDDLLSGGSSDSSDDPFGL